MKVGSIRVVSGLRPTCDYYSQTTMEECEDLASRQLIRDGLCGYEVLTLCLDHADDFGPDWAEETWEWVSGWRRAR